MKSNEMSQLSDTRVVKVITQDKNIGGTIEFVVNKEIDEKLFEKTMQKKLAKIIAKQIFEDEGFKENILNKISYGELAL